MSEQRVAIGANNRVWMLIDDRYGPGSAREMLGRSLGAIDGDADVSVLLWHMPDGRDIDQVDPASEATEYIQCAGDGERFTVEVREREGDGYRHEVLGPPGEQQIEIATEDQVRISWKGGFADVYQREIFTAEAAVAVLDEYRLTRRVSDGYSRRSILDASTD